MAQERTFSLTKTTVECYKVRCSTGGYWADITVDSNGNAGRIQIASDYGSWEHYWGSCGCSFKQFLIDLTKNIHYAAGKFGAADWFDHEATMKELRNSVQEYFYYGAVEEDEQESINRELEILDDCTQKDQFISEAYHTSALCRTWDTGPDIKTDVSPMFKRFWSEIWPVFVSELQKELNPA